MNVGKAPHQMKNLYLKMLTIALLMPASIVAQTVTSGLTLEEYVNDILLGSGVEAFNIELTGSDVQVGYLQDAEGIPLTEGLVLLRRQQKILLVQMTLALTCLSVKVSRENQIC